MHLHTKNGYCLGGGAGCSMDALNSLISEKKYENLLTKYIFDCHIHRGEGQLYKNALCILGQPGVGTCTNNFMLVGWLSQARGLRTPKSKQVEVFLSKIQ